MAPTIRSTAPAEGRLNLTPDDVTALLDSMKSNDHCVWAYHMEIQKLRDRIEAFAGDGGLVLARDFEPSPVEG